MDGNYGWEGILSRRGQLGPVPAPMTKPSLAKPAALPTLPGPVEDEDMTPKGLQQLMFDEGTELKVYKDTKGIPTIGVGFNLEEPANKELFETVTGMSVDDAIAGKPISKDHAHELLTHTVQRAETDAQSLVSPERWQMLDDKQRDAVTNFVFNVGLPVASTFKNTFKYINNGNGENAADNIRNSRYYKQVGARGERVAKAIESISNKAPPMDVLEGDDGKFYRMINGKPVQVND